MMVLTLEYFEDSDRYGEVYSETLSGKSDAGTEVRFGAYNLNECPEDAIIGRDLFSAADFIEALKLGMELGRQGYTEIELVEGKDDD